MTLGGLGSAAIACPLSKTVMTRKTNVWSNRSGRRILFDAQDVSRDFWFPSPGFAGEGLGVRGFFVCMELPSPPAPLPQSRESGVRKLNCYLLAEVMTSTCITDDTLSRSLDKRKSISFLITAT